MVSSTDIDIARSAELFHALSDETRLEVIDLLGDGERCVCDLMDAVGAAQSRLSFHLRVLKDAGLVVDRREGRWSYYELNREAFEQAGLLLKELTPRTRRRAAVVDGCCG